MLPRLTRCSFRTFRTISICCFSYFAFGFGLEVLVLVVPIHDNCLIFTLSAHIWAGYKLASLIPYKELYIDKLASLRSQGWGTPLYINMEISLPSRLSLYDTQVNAINLSMTDKHSAHESCFN